MATRDARERGVAMWREALELEEGEADRARVAFNSGNVLLETGELSAAKKMFERTLSFGEVGPYASKAHTQLGITMQRMGERRRMR